MLQNSASSDRIGPREAKKRSSRLPTLFILLLLAAAAYYIFSGVEKSYEKVQSSEVNRLAGQAPYVPQANSRGAADNRRSDTYANAIKNSPGLTQSRQHLDETNKLMQASTGNTANR